MKRGGNLYEESSSNFVVVLAGTLSGGHPTAGLLDPVTAGTAANLVVRSGTAGTNHTRAPVVLGLSRIAGESSQNTEGVPGLLNGGGGDLLVGRPARSLSRCNFRHRGNPIAEFPTAILNDPRWPSATTPVIGWALHGADDSDGRYSNHAIINNAVTPSSPAGWHQYVTNWARAAAAYRRAGHRAPGP